MQGFFSQGISFRLAKVGVVIALSVGVLISAVQIYIDYRLHTDEINRLVSRISAVSTPPAVRSVHTLDDMLAKEVASGLMSYDFIVEVVILDELNQVL